jgi:hypothetical protein
MTTGRINQVTIVRRLRPTARVSGQKSSLSYWVAGTRPAWPRSSSGVRRSRRGSHPLSPPEFPRALSAGENGEQTRPEDTA